MIRAFRIPLILSLCCAAIGIPAVAHHSFAMFDQKRISELRGVSVVRFAWGNPHVFVTVKSGETVYTLECGSPSNMNATGWKFNTLKAGEKIDITFFPLLNGKPGGALKTATLSTGQKLQAW